MVPYVYARSWFFFFCLVIFLLTTSASWHPVAKQDHKTTLLGSGLQEETTVLRWASFTDYELLPPIMAWINPVIGRSEATPEQLAQLEENCELTVRAVETSIKGKQFLVGDTLTIADLFVISGLARGYQYVSYPFFLLWQFFWGISTLNLQNFQGFHENLGGQAPRRSRVLHALPFRPNFYKVSW